MERKSPLLSASLLSADFTQLGKDTVDVVAHGADWVHIDVMDGVFVPNLTIGIPVIASLRKVTKAFFDVHLMIVQPERHVEEFIRAGADMVTIHCENNPNSFATLAQIHSSGAKAGIALNPATPAEMVRPLLPFVDMVLVMTVNPGFGGQKHIAAMNEKIRVIREWIEKEKLETLIQVDGGITAETLPACYQAGANCFVAGTAIFGHPAGMKAGIETLKNAA